MMALLQLVVFISSLTINLLKHWIIHEVNLKLWCVGVVLFGVNILGGSDWLEHAGSSMYPAMGRGVTSRLDVNSGSNDQQKICCECVYKQCVL